jgi:hypothetical protein
MSNGSLCNFNFTAKKCLREKWVEQKGTIIINFLPHKKIFQFFFEITNFLFSDQIQRSSNIDGCLIY